MKGLYSTVSVSPLSRSEMHCCCASIVFWALPDPEYCERRLSSHIQSVSFRQGCVTAGRPPC